MDDGAQGPVQTTVKCVWSPGPGLFSLCLDCAILSMTEIPHHVVYVYMFITKFPVVSVYRRSTYRSCRISTINSINHCCEAVADLGSQKVGASTGAPHKRHFTDQVQDDPWRQGFAEGAAAATH